MKQRDLGSFQETRPACAALARAGRGFLEINFSRKIERLARLWQASAVRGIGKMMQWDVRQTSSRKLWNASYADACFCFFQLVILSHINGSGWWLPDGFLAR